ncbi:hypothetical protein [Kitasatospora sp. McL0602]|uniref:hypothetical protein n=1 Tax=Kitasatospora sp. McL0602 TaxID=3439530 RepID=UPI003F8CF21E
MPDGVASCRTWTGHAAGPADTAPSLTRITRSTHYTRPTRSARFTPTAGALPGSSFGNSLSTGSVRGGVR